jgi:DNA-binding IclR family transcriptional regulator
MAESATNRVRTTEKSFAIVEALQRQDGAGVTELATELEMSKSTVHSHLSTLVDCGYVTKHDGRYHVSTKFLRLGARLRDQSPLYQAARGELTNVATETGGIAHLYVKDGEYTTLLAQEGSHPNVRERRLGEQASLTSSAPGVAILAESTRGREGDPACAGVDFDGELLERLERVRERGYAVETGSESSERTLAASLADPDETVVGALSVSVPPGTTAANRASPGEHLVEAAERTRLNITSWYDSRVTFSPKHAWHD